MKVVRSNRLMRMFSWWQQSYWRLDVAITFVVGFLTIIGTFVVAQTQPDRRPLDALALAVLATAAATLGFRRRYPGWVLIIANALTLLYLLLDYPKGPNFIVTVVAFIAAALHGRRQLAWTVLAAEFVLFPWLPYALGQDIAPTSTVMARNAGWLLVLAIGTELAHLRQQRQQRIRDEERQRRAAEERLRIARDLHDVLGHNISLISVQASVALHLMDQRPEQARIALSVIRDASKDALRELRSVLDVLREVPEAPPREPAPGLAMLGDLVARAFDAGLQVQTEISGDLTAVPVSVDLTAFRIIQEALTNVMRHSGQSAARVQVRCTEHELTLQIDNAVARDPSLDGRGPGQGILGMQERAAALGGVVNARPRPDGGFRVVARLPLAGSRYMLQEAAE